MFLCSIALYSIGPCFYHQSHPQMGVVFALAPSLHSFWSYFSIDLHIGHLPTWEVPLSVSYHFALSYCSWSSQGKNTEVVCHSLLQWNTFCQTSPPWPVRLGWPYKAWHSFIELDKDTQVRVIRLASFLWKSCTQNASKFRKLNSGHRTGKGHFSFQSQRKAMPKNAETATQLHSSHTLVK